MSNISFSPKYKPLFKLLNGDYPEVDTVIITGGRGSAKSFVVAVLTLIGLVEYGWNVLYTRFTNISITDSIKPEVDDKIKRLGYDGIVESTNNEIRHNGNRIAFKGIKTGSQQQTANLKSLSGFNVFVVDEAEEMPDLETFEKVYLSIRSNTKQNITILVLNPATIHQWIYRHFFEGMDVEGGANTVKDNVMYIHTTYKDVKPEHLAPNVVEHYQKMEKNDPKRYNQVVAGGWVSEVEDRIYSGWLRMEEDKFNDLPYPSYYGLDFGAANPTALVEVKYDGNGTVFIHEKIYKPSDHMKGTLAIYMESIGIDKKTRMVCDSAERDSITALAMNGFVAIPALKGAGSVNHGIQTVQSLKVYYTKSSKNLDREYANYQWDVFNGMNLEKPIKKDDHLMDALRYAIARMSIDLRF